MRYLTILVLAVPLFWFTLPANAGEGDNAIDALHTFLGSVQSLQARFEQVILDETGEAYDTATGILRLARPGRFHWEYEQPYRQVLMSDGETLWVYDIDLEQVTISDAGDSLGESPAALLSGDAAVEDNYLVNDLGHIDDGVRVELVPRVEETEFNRVLLDFRDDVLIRMTLFDNLGQTTQISLTDVQTDIEPTARQFSFIPPQGVDVIDSRE